MSAADSDRAGRSADDEGFVQRWSRRKRETQAAGPPAAQAPELTPAPADAGDPPVLTDADMPALDTLGEESDFSGFLSPGVSEGLRRQALQRMFALPSVNQRCPLDGEWYDLRDCKPLGDTITWEMREAIEREAEAAAERLTKQVTEPTGQVAAESSGMERSVADAGAAEAGAVEGAPPARDLPEAAS